MALYGARLEQRALTVSLTDEEKDFVDKASTALHKYDGPVVEVRLVATLLPFWSIFGYSGYNSMIPYVKYGALLQFFFLRALLKAKKGTCYTVLYFVLLLPLALDLALCGFGLAVLAFGVMFFPAIDLCLILLCTVFVYGILRVVQGRALMKEFRAEV